MHETNVQVVGAASALATVAMWLLGYYQPELMSEAPIGLEAAFTGIIVVALGLIIPKHSLLTKKQRERLNNDS